MVIPADNRACLGPCDHAEQQACEILHTTQLTRGASRPHVRCHAKSCWLSLFTICTARKYHRAHFSLFPQTQSEIVSDVMLAACCSLHGYGSSEQFVEQKQGDIGTSSIANRCKQAVGVLPWRILRGYHQTDHSGSACHRYPPWSQPSTCDRAMGPALSTNRLYLLWGFSLGQQEPTASDRSGKRMQDGGSWLGDECAVKPPPALPRSSHRIPKRHPLSRAIYTSSIRLQLSACWRTREAA